MTETENKSISIVTFTDLEPDDLLAIRVIQHKWQPCHHTLVLGEGDMSRGNKFAVAQKLLGFFPKTTFEIIRGESSDKEYPIVVDSPVLPEYSTWSVDLIKDVCSKCQIVFSLKPPRELVALPRDVRFPDAVLRAYGSFNFRTMKLTKEDVDELVNRFHDAFVIESFACIGENNSVGKDFFAGRAPSTPEKTEFLAFFRQVMEQWNRFIYDDCVSDVLTASKALYEKGELDVKEVNRFMRNAKVALALQPQMDGQFVLADPIVAMIPERWCVRSALVSMEPYPTYTPYPYGQINVVVGGDAVKEERRALILAQLDELLL